MQRTHELLERMCVSLEKISNDPEIEIDAGPPLCPSCGTLNPKVRLPQTEGGTGPLGEIMIEAICASCSHTIYVVIESYSCHNDREKATLEAQGRAESYENV